MTIILSVLGVVLFLLLISIEAVHPKHASLSIFELRRRHSARDRRATEALEREKLLAQIGLIRAHLRGLLLVGLTLLMMYLLGWQSGGVIALIVGVFYSRISRFAPVSRMASSLYGKYELQLLTIAHKHKKKLQLLGGKASLRDEAVAVGSREELAHILKASNLFADDEERLMENVLRFKDKTVRDIMIPKDAMVTVKYAELLGPLVLDDLHKTSHTIFPVVKGKDVVGLLDSSDHVALRSKDSPRVRDVMNADIVKVDQTEQLDTVLRMFVDTGQRLLIVIDEENQVIGLVSLGDVIRALTGWSRR